MKKIKRILLAFTLGVAVLFTGCGKQDTPADGNGNNIFGNNNTGNNNNNGNNNTGNNNGNNNGNNEGFGTSFTFSGLQMNMVNAVHASESGATAILFEGTNNYGDAVIIVAMTTSGFDNSTTYSQNNFGNTIEILVVAVNTSGGDYSFGSSATGGVTGSQIAIGSDGSASVSGTLISDSYGNMPFSAQGAITKVSMDNIRDKINAYDQAISSANGNGGGNTGNGGNGGNGGNNGTTMRCPDCRGLLNCRSCGGDGTCHICVEGMDHCLSCGGSRVCQHCHGQRTCPWCNGTGVYTP